MDWKGDYMAKETEFQSYAAIEVINYNYQGND
jgi:hypothetical protein